MKMNKDFMTVITVMEEKFFEVREMVMRMDTKRKGVIAGALIILIVMSLTMCGDSVERYAKQNPEFAEFVEENCSIDDEEMIEFDGNTVILPMDTPEDLTECDRETTAFIKNMYQMELDSDYEKYGELAAAIEEETGMDGVVIRARYIDENGKTLAEGDFTSDIVRYYE